MFSTAFLPPTTTTTRYISIVVLEVMRFTCTQENILSGLSRVTHVAGRNAQLPILQNILMQVKDGLLHITGTDLEVGIHAVVGGKVGEEGSCALSARQVYEYVQQLPTSHPVEIVRGKRGVAITTKGFKSMFQTAETEDFPLLPEVGDQGGMPVSPRGLCQGLADTTFAAAREETRPEIHSVFVEVGEDALRVAATDSFRLAERLMPFQSGEKTFSFLLPLTTAQEIVRLFSDQESGELFFRETMVSFRGEGVDLTSRLVDGSYPDYRQIIPSDFQSRFYVKREELARALKTLLVFLPRDTRRMRLLAKAAKGKLELRVEGGEAGEGEVVLQAEGEGEDTELLLNIQYLLEGVQHLSGEKCEILLNGPEAPVTFRPRGSEGYTYVVMPIQA